MTVLSCNTQFVYLFQFTNKMKADKRFVILTMLEARNQITPNSLMEFIHPSAKGAACYCSICDSVHRTSLKAIDHLIEKHLNHPQIRLMLQEHAKRTDYRLYSKTTISKLNSAGITIEERAPTFAFPKEMDEETLHGALKLYNRAWSCPLCDTDGIGYHKAFDHLVNWHMSFPGMLEALDLSTKKYDNTISRSLRENLKRISGRSDEEEYTISSTIPDRIHDRTLHEMVGYDKAGQWECPMCGEEDETYRRLLDHMINMHMTIPRMVEVLKASVTKHVNKSLRHLRLNQLEQSQTIVYDERDGTDEYF